MSCFVACNRNCLHRIPKPILLHEYIGNVVECDMFTVKSNNGVGRFNKTTMEAIAFQKKNYECLQKRKKQTQFYLTT